MYYLAITITTLKGIIILILQIETKGCEGTTSGIQSYHNNDENKDG